MESDAESTGPRSRSNYDSAEKFYFGFLATTTLPDLQGCSGVIFAGLPRAGKSSAVAVQRGATLHADNSIGDGRTRYVPVYRRGDPKVSHGMIPKTINVNIFRDWRGRRNIIDVPGMNDDREEPYKGWSNFSLSTAFGIAQSIEATCVVVDFSCFHEGANNYRVMAKTLLSNAGTGEAKEKFIDNLCFFLTHCETASLEGVMNRLTEVYKDELTAQRNILATLKRDFPVEQNILEVGRETALALKTRLGDTFLQSKSPLRRGEILRLCRETETLRGQIDFSDERVANHDQARTLPTISLSLDLLEAMLLNRDRVVISCPNGRARCHQQRLTLDSVAEKCRSLSHNDLRKCQRLLNYEVYGILGRIASKMQSKLEAYNTAMSTFLQSVKEEDTVISCINAGWEAYRDRYVTILQQSQREKARSIRTIEATIQRLETSTRLVLPPENMYNVTKTFDGWFGWLGLGSVTSDPFTHRGSYQDCEVVGQYGSHDLSVGEDGATTVTVTSKGPRDIRAQVRFLVWEKDLEQTRLTITQKTEQIQRLREEVRQSSDLILALETVPSANALMNKLVFEKMEHEIATLRHASGELTALVSTGIYDDDEEGETELDVPYMQACTGLFRLIEALRKRYAIPSDITAESAVSQSFDAFEKEYKEYHRLNQDYNCSASAHHAVKAKQVRDVETVSHHQKNGGSVPSPDTNNQERLHEELGKQCLDFITLSLVPVFVTLLRQNPLISLGSFGVALMGMGLKLDPFVTASFTVFSLFLLVGASQMICAARRAVNAEIDGIKDQIERRIDESLQLVQDGGAETARQLDELRSVLISELEERGRLAARRMTVEAVVKGAFGSVLSFLWG